jgi:hypothetical protein
MVKGRLSYVVYEAIQLKNENQSRAFLKQWRFAELLAALFSTFGILSASAEYEFGFSENRTHDNCKENPSQPLRFITLIFTLISAFFLVHRHRIKVQWRNSRPLENLNTKGSAFIKSKTFISFRLIIELCILTIFPYPFLSQNLHLNQPSIHEKNEKFSNQIPLCYTLSEFLYVFMFIRFFFIIRALFNFTPYQDDHARFYCSKSKTRSNLRFTLRIMMKTHPFLLIYSVSVFTFVVIGVIVRVFERPYSDVSGQNFESFENSIWNTAIYMATVGYGDLFPSTTFGRAFAVIGTFWGAFVFSMIVFTFQTMLQLDSYQKRSFLSIKQTRAATRVVVAALVFQLYKKKFGGQDWKTLKAFHEMMEKLKKFTGTMKKLKRVDTFVEENLNRTRFVKVFHEVALLEQKILELTEKRKGAKET